MIYHHPFRAKLHKPKVTHNTLAKTAAFHALYQIHNMPKKHGRPHHCCAAYTVNHGCIVSERMTEWMGKRVRLSLANFFLIFIPHVLLLGRLWCVMDLRVDDSWFADSAHAYSSIHTARTHSHPYDLVEINQQINFPLNLISFEIFPCVLFAVLSPSLSLPRSPRYLYLFWCLSVLRPFV